MSFVARAGGAAVALAVGLAVVPAAAAHAVRAAVPIDCTVAALRQAINDANNGGGGTIDLAPKCTYTLTDANTVGGPNGLPEITTAITLNGDKKTVIERSSAAGTPAFRFFEVLGPNGDLTLNRLTLRNGSAGNGGAILVQGGAELAVNASHLTDNHAGGDGGAINGRPGGSTVTVTSSSVKKNSAGNGGGGIVAFGSLSLSRTEVSENTARIAGGVGVQNATATLSHSEVKGNTATGAATGTSGGGGVALVSATATLNSTSVTKNKATGSGADGGGIRDVGGSTLNLRSSRVSGNTATDQGGGIFSQNVLNVRSSTIEDNTAVNQGGGVWNSGTARFDVTVLKGNKTTAAGSLGGGLFNGAGTAALHSSKVIKNSAVADGGGVYETPGTTVTANQTDFERNRPNNCAPNGAVAGCVG
ncbi:hypothetical protein [Streptomyces sp. NPDC000410]|uniref:hypothetical protein n=1 Tax=Streptomyces sp. NPDC000410 TaxID=3154254 RepID=UPI00331B253A